MISFYLFENISSDIEKDIIKKCVVFVALYLLEIYKK